MSERVKQVVRDEITRLNGERVRANEYAENAEKEFRDWSRRCDVLTARISELQTELIRDSIQRGVEQAEQGELTDLGTFGDDLCPHGYEITGREEVCPECNPPCSKCGGTDNVLTTGICWGCTQ